MLIRFKLLSLRASILQQERGSHSWGRDEFMYEGLANLFASPALICAYVSLGCDRVYEDPIKKHDGLVAIIDPKCSLVFSRLVVVNGSTPRQRGYPKRISIGQGMT